jgi:hypothetical protein
MLTVSEWRLPWIGTGWDKKNVQRSKHKELIIFIINFFTSSF